MDLKNIAGITQKQIKDSAKPKGKIKDSIAKRRLSDSYKETRKKLKDDMSETATTDEAIEVALAAIEAGADPIEVSQAAIEIISEVVDVLEDKLEEAIGGDDPDDVPPAEEPEE